MFLWSDTLPAANPPPRYSLISYVTLAQKGEYNKGALPEGLVISSAR